MLHEAIFLATCNATMTNKKPFKLQRGCYTQATCLATLQKVWGRSTFLATRNATIAVAKGGATRACFLAATFASCNMQPLNNKLFIIWLFALVLRVRNRTRGHYGRIMPYNWPIRMLCRLQTQAII